MKISLFLSAATVSFGVIFAVTPSAHAWLLTNGDFSSGLTGWTPYTLTNGTIGTPAVVNFDVTGLGSNPAAQLRVGQVSFQPAVQSGGGLSQMFTGPAGDYSFSYDFASENAGIFDNGSGGLFSLIFDGTTLDSFNTADINSGSTERGSLSAFLAGVTAGTHEIRIQATRPFLASGTTPFQYFDNVVVVPGPLPLLGVGAAFGFSRKLRKRINGSTPVH